MGIRRKAKWLDDERRAWLESLKVGDEVSMGGGWGGPVIRPIYAIDGKVISVRGYGDFLRLDGYAADKHDRGGIHPATDEMREEIRRSNAVNAVANLSRHELSGIDTDTLVEFAAKVKAANKKTDEVEATP